MSDASLHYRSCPSTSVNKPATRAELAVAQRRTDSDDEARLIRTDSGDGAAAEEEEVACFDGSVARARPLPRMPPPLTPPHHQASLSLATPVRDRLSVPRRDCVRQSGIRERTCDCPSTR